MTEELSDNDMSGLAKQEVGLLANVDEAIAILRAIVPVLKRADAECTKHARINSAKFADDGDRLAYVTSVEMHAAALRLRNMVNEIKELAKYV